MKNRYIATLAFIFIFSNIFSQDNCPVIHSVEDFYMEEYTKQINFSPIIINIENLNPSYTWEKDGVKLENKTGSISITEKGCYTFSVTDIDSECTDTVSFNVIGYGFEPNTVFYYQIPSFIDSGLVSKTLFQDFRIDNFLDSMLEENDMNYIFYKSGEYYAFPVDNKGLDCGVPDPIYIDNAYRLNYFPYISHANCQGKGGVFSFELDPNPEQYSDEKDIAFDVLWEDGSQEKTRLDLDLGLHKCTITNDFGVEKEIEIELFSKDMEVKHAIVYDKCGTGELNLFVENALLPLTYLWNNGDSIFVKENFEAYQSVAITDKSGCETTVNVQHVERKIYNNLKIYYNFDSCRLELYTDYFYPFNAFIDEDTIDFEVIDNPFFGRDAYASIELEPNTTVQLSSINLVSNCERNYSLETNADGIYFKKSTFEFTDVEREVAFTVFSKGGVHFWDFGDDSSSIERNPKHIYEENGDYTVMHKVSSSCGEYSEIIHILGVATENILPSDDFNFYPNPFSDEICIEFPKAENAILEIFDLMGKRIEIIDVPNKKTYNWKGNVENGVFIVKYSNVDGIYAKRVFKR